MRIIAGNLKGRKLKHALPPNVRPTTDSVRETIFNILSNYIDFDELTIADICAGSGMLGFEAISRGASYCYFIDNNKKVANTLNQNAISIGIPEDKFEIINFDSLKFLKNIKSVDTYLQFDIMFYDPPYVSKTSNNFLLIIEEMNLISDNGIVVTEHSDKEAIITTDYFFQLSSKKFGETIVDFWQKK